jgi:glycosyltransferase involved in cell wall biosynthesis
MNHEDIKISHSTIVKNEERVISRCIDSIKDVVSEFVIVDTGSSDDSVALIENKVGKCYHTSWEGDYAKARNFGVKLCQGDWVFVLDADEWLLPESAKNLKKILANTPEDVWEILVRVQDYTDPSMIPTYIVYGHRLFRNNKGILWGGKGHEALTTPLNHRIQDSRIVVMHDKTPNAVSPIAPKKNELAQVFVENFLTDIKNGVNVARSMFYLAQTYMSRLQYIEAIEWFLKYFEISNWKDERYQARYYCARCYMYLGEFTLAREMMLDAYEERDDRNEGEMVLGEVAFKQKKYKQALMWFTLAKDKMEYCKEHGLPDTLLFLEGRAYTYQPYDWLAIVYWQLGDKENARKYTLKALEILPNDERLKGNLEYYK